MKTVIVFLAEGFEEVEAVTPIDFLRRAEINVITIGIGGKFIEGAHGIKITADKVFAEMDKRDFMIANALVFPGGMPGAENISAEVDIIDLISSFNSEEKIIAAICASPGVILSKTDALESKAATCYPGFERFFSEKTKFKEEPVVVDGNLITSRGPGTAAAFAIELIRMLKGKNEADKIKTMTLQSF